MGKLQTERQAVGDYRLEVTDFGPIAKASVDLRPLTVFIGPSNTGKSYLAILMYALHRCFGGPDNYFPPRSIRYLRRDMFYSDVPMDSQTREDVMNWVQGVSLEQALPPLPDSLEKFVRNRLERLSGFDDLLREEICRSFGIDTLAETIRHPNSNNSARITLTVPQKTTVDAVRYCIELTQDDKVGFFGEFPSSISFLDEARPPDRDHDELAYFIRHLHRLKVSRAEFDEIDDMTASLVVRLFNSALSSVVRAAYYLPADRTGVMHSHQVVVSALIQNATTGGLRPSANIPMLSSVLADFLDHLIAMTSRERSLPRRARHSQHSDQAKRLERNVLQGTIQMSRTETGYPRFFYRPEGWQEALPLMRSSSMVSELAPVVLYLRYLVRPGDVLIIEEPESHLHPAMQAVFARELAWLVRSGIRVVVTTHSEWLLDQFANLVRLSGLPEDKRKEFPGADEALQPEQFGAWLFKQKRRPKGSVVEELSIDPDAGGLVSDYNEVAEQLYNEWVRIGNRIEEGRNE